MAKRQTRKSISVNAALYDLIICQSAAANQSCSQWLSLLVRERLAAIGVEAPPQVFTSELAAERASAHAIRVAHAAGLRMERAAMRIEARTGQPAPDFRPVPDPSKVKAPRGARPRPAEIFTGFCALCVTGPGPFSLAPFGKDDADVQVCTACVTETAREGNHSFGRGGQSGGALSNSGGGRVGAGGSAMSRR